MPPKSKKDLAIDIEFMGGPRITDEMLRRMSKAEVERQHGERKRIFDTENANVDLQAEQRRIRESDAYKAILARDLFRRQRSEQGKNEHWVMRRWLGASDLPMSALKKSFEQMKKEHPPENFADVERGYLNYARQIDEVDRETSRNVSREAKRQAIFTLGE